jgi:uncharacterized protein YkvS
MPYIVKLPEGGQGVQNREHAGNTSVIWNTTLIEQSQKNSQWQISPKHTVVNHKKYTSVFQF